MSGNKCYEEKSKVNAKTLMGEAAILYSMSKNISNISYIQRKWGWKTFKYLVSIKVLRIKGASAFYRAYKGVRGSVLEVKHGFLKDERVISKKHWRPRTVKVWVACGYGNMVCNALTVMLLFHRVQGLDICYGKFNGENRKLRQWLTDYC